MITFLTQYGDKNFLAARKLYLFFDDVFLPADVGQQIDGLTCDQLVHRWTLLHSLTLSENQTTQHTTHYGNQGWILDVP